MTEIQDAVSNPNGRVFAGRRMTMRFMWEEVDVTLIRALLLEAYRQADRPPDADLIRGLDDAALVRQANATLGRPPHRSVLEPLAETLRDRWLKSITRAELDELAVLVQLSLSGSDRTATFSTKTSLLDFFQQRRMTDTFRRHLRDAFVRVHKRSVPVETSSTGSRGRRQEVVHLLGHGIADRRRPYEHQIEAWQRLDGLKRARSAEKRRGLVVLPTGAGKTFTMVAWLLK
jgi:Type III restriction enzyme, res subunit